MRIFRFLVQTILALVVFGAASFGAFQLYISKPKVAPAPPKERVWRVEADAVNFADVQPQLQLFGDVVAGRTVELRALVAGEILAVGERFRDGGAVKTGDMIAKIDDFDYRTILAERRAQLVEAKARLDEIKARQKSHAEALIRDQEILALQERHLSRVQKLKAKGAGTDRALDNAKLDIARQQQIMSNRSNEIVAEAARLAQQQALITRLEVGITRMERDLERTILAAPFDGYLYDITAEVGKRLSVNDRVARLIDASRLEVAVHLSDSQFGRLISSGETLVGRKAQVSWKIGSDEIRLAATIDRVAPTINAASGGVDAYAVLDRAAISRSVRPGAFVTILLPDKVYRQVARLPETALNNDLQVFVIKDGRLERRQIELIARQGNDVLVKGELKDGEKVVRHLFAEIGPGVKVDAR